MFLPVRKFTLRWLIGLVFLLCAALAFLRVARRDWGPGEITTLCLIILVVTTILAWFPRARGRVFWAGFALFGWASLIIALGTPTGDQLPTSLVLDGLHVQWYPIPLFENSYDSGESLARQIDPIQFRNAGHSVISLVLGLLGGIGAWLVFPKRKDDRTVEQLPEGSILKTGWRTAERGERS